MIDKLTAMSVEEIINGFMYDNQTGKYVCNICGREYENGEIYKSGDRFFEASRIIEMHIRDEHANMLDLLCSNDKKYTGLTDNQKELLSMIYSGMTDNEIAKKTGVAAATIRHQRFAFREKAKQAKLYLAIYELALQGAGGSRRIPDKSEEIIDVHKGAKMVDDRYFTTKEEEEQIIETMFYSINPLKLKTFSPKEKKKIVILRKIAGEFDKNKRYSEKEINSVLKEIYEDFATVRRYLIEYGFMDRTKDCKEYWLK